MMQIYHHTFRGEDDKCILTMEVNMFCKEINRFLRLFHYGRPVKLAPIDKGKLAYELVNMDENDFN